MLPNSYASRIAERRNKPVVITAHGTLEPWALGHSGWKKRFVGFAFQNRDLHRAACIHVNSKAEATGIRAYGLRQPIAVIPNGIDASFLAVLPGREQFERAFSQAAGRRIVLFMGRLHKKKGLEPLIRAWGRLASQFSDWILVVAGPDNGFETPTRRLIEELRLSTSVILTGNLQGQAKREALGAAELFALPSFSEGFSMAVLEAMASGLPVLLTRGCNFPEAAASGAAVEVEASVSGTEAGLRRLLSLKDAERQQMGHSARNLIAAKYTWDRVARQTMLLYNWMTGRGLRPEFILDT
jgi:poly(glycerol-phosphate) alpha-glucosyltransferase